jgi:hypothetical protein
MLPVVNSTYPPVAWTIFNLQVKNTIFLGEFQLEKLFDFSCLDFNGLSDMAEN